jgi:peptidoglycan/LPS O-acetylase OafA/YrhL
MRRAIRALSPVVVVAAVLILTPALSEAGEVKQTPSVVSQGWQWLANLWQEATSWIPALPGEDEGNGGLAPGTTKQGDEGWMIDPNGFV